MLRTTIARGPLALLVVLVLSAAPAVAQSNIYTWNGSTDTSWFEPLNWSVVGPAGPLGPPLNDLTNTFLVMAGSTRLTNDMDLSVEANRLTFLAGSGAFIINSSTNETLKIGDGGIVVVSGNNNNQTFNGKLQIGAAGVWANNGTGTFTVGGAIDTNGFLLTASGTGNSIYNGLISGSGGLTKTDNGTLTIGTALNTYTGNVTLSAGTLQVSGDRAFGAVPGSATAGKIVFNGGTLSVTTGFTLSGNRGILIDSAGGTIAIASGQTVVYGSGGILAGTGQLTVSGGRLTLSSNATWTGPLVVSGGGIVSYNNQLLLNAGSTETITLNGGTLELTNTSVPGNGTFSPTGRNITLGAGGGTLRYDTVGGLSIVQNTGSGTVISGIGGLTKEGAGVIAVGMAATYQGPTHVVGGTLRVRNGNNMFPIGTALTVDSGATFDLDTRNQQVGSLSGAGVANVSGGTFTVGDSTSTNYAGVIQGASGKLTKIGTGTLTLSGTNTYTGATTINAGTLSIGMGGSLHTSSAVSVNNTATLSGVGVVNGTVTVASGGTLVPGSGGAGTLTIGGNTTLNSGSHFAISAAASGSNNAVSIQGGSTILDFKNGSILDLSLLTGFTNLTAQSYTIVSMPSGSGANVYANGISTSPGQVLGTFVQGSGASGVVSIVPSGFALTSGDTFTLTRTGDSVQLTFTPVPEPREVMMVAFAALGFWELARRRNRGKIQV